MRVTATGVLRAPSQPVSRECPSAPSLILKAYYILVTWWDPVKIRNLARLLCLFCWGEIFGLAWCGPGGQLWDLGRCHFRLRLHSHMTSVVRGGTAQEYGLEKFHHHFHALVDPTNVWHLSVYAMCTVVDWWSYLCHFWKSYMRPHVAFSPFGVDNFNSRGYINTIVPFLSLQRHVSLYVHVVCFYHLYLIAVYLTTWPWTCHIPFSWISWLKQARPKSMSMSVLCSCHYQWKQLVAIWFELGYCMIITMRMIVLYKGQSWQRVRDTRYRILSSYFTARLKIPSLWHDYEGTRWSAVWTITMVFTSLWWHCPVEESILFGPGPPNRKAGVTKALGTLF